MATTYSERVPVWFWIVAGVALLWNLVGVYSYLAEVGVFGEAARMPGPWNAMPAWVTAAYAIGVFGAVIGVLGLLLRQRWAGLVLLISLVALIVDWGWVFFASGAGVQPLGSAVLVISALLVWFASYATKRGWLK
jgi:hypothetical protein